jgi:predicted MPP superfamily phosphohydrolase
MIQVDSRLRPRGFLARVGSVSNGQAWFLTVLFCAAFTLYAAAAIMLLRAVAGRIFKSLKPASRLYRGIRWAVWILAILGIVALLYARFIEPRWLEVSRFQVRAPRLPAGAGPVRIALVSDLHTESFERLESRVAAAVERERPDLILYAGDSLNAEEGLPIFRRLMTRLAATAPTFAVRGNWDGLFHVDLFGGTGVRELKASGAEVQVRGARLWIAGLPAGCPVATGRLAGQAPPGAVRILLCHWPNEFTCPGAGEFDLWCAGHTHGGQVALPFYGALLKSPPEGPHYERGLYLVNGTPLVVTRGVGMEGGPVFRARFCSRPEVAIIELAPD